jgi:enoyl-CoA hydratase/carnithine racemase
MATFEHVLYEKRRGGVLISLNRPETLNALSKELQRELNAALREAEADSEVRAVVLAGAGRAFSAGANMRGDGGPVEWPYGLPEEESVADLVDRWRGIATNGHRSRRMNWEFSKPIISAVNGWRMGAGSWLALSCHMTYAAESVVFAQPEVRMISNTGVIWPVLAGYKDALRYSLTGDYIDAGEALRVGLVNEVVPDNRLIDECFELMERIALVSPETAKINLMVATSGLEIMGFD